MKPGQMLQWWKRAQNIPGGRFLFSKANGRAAPYTGSVKGLIREMRPGYAEVVMKDRRRVRNHLNSVHAIALMNLAEMASGLAMISRFADNQRGIITGLSIQYLKKARGVLTAVSDHEETTRLQDGPYDAPAVIKDASGQVVATATAHWLVDSK